MSAFQTGSRVYGKPREDSDWDLVVKIPQARAEAFLATLPPEVVKVQTGEYGARTGQVTLRFGSLNLILCTNRETYDAWWAATQMASNLALANGPLEKAEAVQLFRDEFSRRGIEDVSSGNSGGSIELTPGEDVVINNGGENGDWLRWSWYEW